MLKSTNINSQNRDSSLIDLSQSALTSNAPSVTPEAPPIPKRREAPSEPVRVPLPVPLPDRKPGFNPQPERNPEPIQTPRPLHPYCPG